MNKAQAANLDYSILVTINAITDQLMVDFDEESEQYGRMYTNPESLCIFKDSVEKLSPPARELINSVLNPSDEFLDELAIIPAKNSTYMPKTRDPDILFLPRRFWVLLKKRHGTTTARKILRDIRAFATT